MLTIMRGFSVRIGGLVAGWGRLGRDLLGLPGEVGGALGGVEFFSDDVEDHGEDDEDGEDDAGCPGEDVAGFCAEGSVSACATEGAGEPAAAAFLDEDEEDEDGGHEEEEEEEGPVEVEPCWPR